VCDVRSKKAWLGLGECCQAGPGGLAETTQPHQSINPVELLCSSDLERGNNEQ